MENRSVLAEIGLPIRDQQTLQTVRVHRQKVEELCATAASMEAGTRLMVSPMRIEGPSQFPDDSKMQVTWDYRFMAPDDNNVFAGWVVYGPWEKPA